MFRAGFYYCDGCHGMLFGPTNVDKKGVGVSINTYDFKNEMDISTESLILCHDCYKNLDEFLKNMII